MRLATAVLVSALVTACGSPRPESGEPTTAAEKQRREAIANGDVDPHGSKWAGWRYQGDRGDCFFVVGRKCFKTEKAACNAARCKTAALCDVVGGGPATVSCKKN